MKIAPALLPHELLVIINHYLSPEDRFACMFVCRQWHDIFSLLYYKSVTIRSLHACVKFHRTLCESEKNKARPLGHVVREISFRQHSPHPVVMQHIPNLCPFLRRFEFCKAEDRLVSYDKDPLIPESTNEALLTPNRAIMSLLLFTHYSKLQLDHLAFECYSGVKSLMFLSAMPQLTSLSLKWKGEWRTEDMDVIHAVCPVLESVQINASSFEYSSMHDTIVNEFETQPAKSLQKMSLNIDRGLSATGYTPWMIYFSRKYPNLQELSLSGRFDMEVAYDIYPEDTDRAEDDVPPIMFFPLFSQWRIEREAYRKQAYTQFFAGCPKLKSLQLTNMRLYRGFFEEMEACQNRPKLQHIAVHDEMLFPSFEIRGVLRHFRDSLTSLSLFSQDSGEESWRRSSPPNVPLLVSQLPHLQHLKIGDMHHVSLKSILDHTPRLKTLTLIHVRLCLANEGVRQLGTHRNNNDRENQTQEDRDNSDDSTVEQEEVTENITTHHQRDAICPHLEKITIRRTPIRQTLLDHIARRCTQLKHFALENCGIYDSPNGLIVIDFPHLNLEALRLESLVFKDKDGFLRYYTGEDFIVKTFALQLMQRSDGLQWYNTGVPSKMHRPTAHDTVIGIRPLDRKNVLALKPKLAMLNRNRPRLDKVPSAGYVHIRCHTVAEIYANDKRLLNDSML